MTDTEAGPILVGLIAFTPEEAKDIRTRHRKMEPILSIAARYPGVGPWHVRELIRMGAKTNRDNLTHGQTVSKVTP